MRLPRHYGPADRAVLPAPALLRHVAQLHRTGFPAADAVAALTRDTTAADRGARAAAILRGRGTLAEALVAADLLRADQAAALVAAGDADDRAEPWTQPDPAAMLDRVADLIEDVDRSAHLTRSTRAAWGLLVAAVTVAAVVLAPAAGTAVRLGCAFIAAVPVLAAAGWYLARLRRLGSAAGASSWGMLTGQMIAAGLSREAAAARADQVVAALGRHRDTTADLDTTAALAASAASGAPELQMAAWGTRRRADAAAAIAAHLAFLAPAALAATAAAAALACLVARLG